LMKTLPSKEILSAVVNGVGVGTAAELAHTSADGIAPGPVRITYALYRSSGLRHIVRLSEAAMGEVAASMAGTPINYEHRPHVGKRDPFDADPHPLQGAILSAEVVDLAGELTIVGELSIDGDTALAEMGRGLIPRASIEFTGDPGTATCTSCDAPWFNRAHNPTPLRECADCGVELGGFDEQGERVYVEYASAEGRGVALLYDPASTGTGPVDMTYQLSALCDDWDRWEITTMGLFGKSKTADAELVPVEALDAAQLEAAHAAISVLTDERTQLQAELDELKTLREQAAEREAVDFAEANHAAIIGLMNSGRITDGPAAELLRAQDPENFDAVLACVSAAPAKGAGQMATSDEPPEPAPSDMARAEQLRTNARQLAVDEGISYHSAILRIAKQETV